MWLGAVWPSQRWEMLILMRKWMTFWLQNWTFKPLNPVLFPHREQLAQATNCGRETLSQNYHEASMQVPKSVSVAMNHWTGERVLKRGLELQIYAGSLTMMRKKSSGQTEGFKSASLLHEEGATWMKRCSGKVCRLLSRDSCCWPCICSYCSSSFTHSQPCAWLWAEYLHQFLKSSV